MYRTPLQERAPHAERQREPLPVEPSYRRSRQAAALAIRSCEFEPAESACGVYDLGSRARDFADRRRPGALAERHGHEQYSRSGRPDTASMLSCSIRRDTSWAICTSTTGRGVAGRYRSQRRWRRSSPSSTSTSSWTTWKSRTSATVDCHWAWRAEVARRSAGSRDSKFPSCKPCR